MDMLDSVLVAHAEAARQVLLCRQRGRWVREQMLEHRIGMRGGPVLVVVHGGLYLLVAFGAQRGLLRFTPQLSRLEITACAQQRLELPAAASSAAGR